MRGLIEKLLANNSGKKKVIVIRHGESNGNVKPTVHGSSDYELTDKGVEQAKEVYNTLEEYVDRVVHIRSSSMVRSIKTCHNAINVEKNKHLHDKLVYDHRIREFQLGTLEGAYCDTDEIPVEDYVTFWDVLLKGFVIPLGSEGGKEFKKRIITSLNDAKEGLNFYFAHSGVIYSLTNSYANRVFVRNCGAVGFVFDDFNEKREFVGMFRND